MKLSEAIRGGAARRPRTEARYFQRDAAGQVCSCALGAAYEGLTGQVSEALGPVVVTLHDHFPLLAEVVHPVDGHRAALKHVMMSLNDDYHWSREQIADWLASIGY